MVPPLDPEVEARAAAESFVQCLERTGTECRPQTGAYQAWAAVRLLGYLRDGSPVGVIARLGTALRATREDGPARKAFVTEILAVEQKLHNADCRTLSLHRFAADGVGPLAQAALGRAERLGLLASDAGPVIRELATIAAPLSEARVAESLCARTDLHFYVLVVPIEGAFRPVSLQTSLPGLAPPGWPTTPLALPVPEDAVSPYIPVAEESL